MAAKRLIGSRRMTGQENRARWVENNREKALEINRQAYKRKVEKINAYKAEQGCQDCGITDHRVLDLHHRDRSEKEFTVALMKSRIGWAKLQEEIAKCDVLCANCHRIRHAVEAEGERDMNIQMTAGTFFRAS